jgi:hypothetical protein
LQSRFAQPFVLLGQHSLPVFSASILLAIFGQALLFNDSGLIWQLIVPSVGSLALIAVGAFSAWNNKAVLPTTHIIKVAESERERVAVRAW